MRILILSIIIFFLSFTMSAERVLRFGLFPTNNSKTMIRLFSPVARKIEQDTGIEVQLISSDSRENFVEKALAGDFDLLWVNNFHYLRIHNETGMYAIARGTPSFHGIVMVRKDSGIDTIQDLVGKNLAIFSKTSLAGFLFLRNNLADVSISITDEIFLKFFKDAESFPFLVYRETVDAAVFSEDTLIRSNLLESIRSELKIIDQSPSIPQFPFCVKTDLDVDLVASIQKSLISIIRNDSLYIEMLDELHLERIEAVDDSGYDGFRKLYEKTMRYNRQE